MSSTTAIHRTGAPLNRYRIPDGYGTTWVYRAGSTWTAPVDPPQHKTVLLAARQRVVLAARSTVLLSARPRVVLD